MMRFGNFASAMVASTGLEFIAVAAVQNSGDSTTLIISSPATVQAGDLLVAIVGVGSTVTGHTWTCPAGWTELVDEGDAPNISVSTLVASSAGSVNYTWTTTSPRKCGGVILVYRGAAFDAIGAIAHAVSGAAITVPSVTTGEANCAVILACFDAGKEITYPDITDWVDRSVASTVNYPSWRVREKLFTAAGATGTVAVNSSATAGENAGLLISIKPA